MVEITYLCNDFGDEGTDKDEIAEWNEEEEEERQAFSEKN